MEWISIDDQIPNDGQWVLAFRPKAHEKPYLDKNIKICKYFGSNVFEYCIHEVTHWMPLPEPPK